MRRVTVMPCFGDCVCFAWVFIQRYTSSEPEMEDMVCISVIFYYRGLQSEENTTPVCCGLLFALQPGGSHLRLTIII